MDKVFQFRLFQCSRIHSADNCGAILGSFNYAFNSLAGGHDQGLWLCARASAVYGSCAIAIGDDCSVPRTGLAIVAGAAAIDDGGIPGMRGGLIDRSGSSIRTGGYHRTTRGASFTVPSVVDAPIGRVTVGGLNAGIARVLAGLALDLLLKRAGTSTTGLNGTTAKSLATTRGLTDGNGNDNDQRANGCVNF